MRCDYSASVQTDRTTFVVPYAFQEAFFLHTNELERVFLWKGKILLVFAKGMLDAQVCTDMLDENYKDWSEGTYPNGAMF